MRTVSVGGGPAGLYFSILMKRRFPRHEVVVLERNRADDTFGFGVVFSDATLENLQAADPESHQRIERAFAHWDDIDVYFGDHMYRSTGHGFAGLARQTLLEILGNRAAELGVDVRYETEVEDIEALAQTYDLVLAADGINSTIRGHYAPYFETNIDWRPNRFVWMGTTRPFPAFTFYFKANRHGLWRVHAYRYAEGKSTFIVECTEETLTAAGLQDASEDQTLAYCTELFGDELKGHPLIKNRSVWRQFATVRNERWGHNNIVLVGDAAHTAHFSIGSGTKIALEDAIALANAVGQHDELPTALAAYETERRPVVESIQRAAQVSLEWFENTERYTCLDPKTFVFSLLTRSLRVTHQNLSVRDPDFVTSIDQHFADRWTANHPEPPAPKDAPPMFTPYRVRDVVLNNRVVVSPMCMYSATDGTVNDWHLVHLGSRAVGGAGLVLAEMTDVSADGRISPGCAGIYEEQHLVAWRRITSFCHRYTEAKVGIQLGHAGRKGATRVPWEGIDQPLPADDGWPLIAASALPYNPHSATPRAMNREDMDRVRDDFVRSTRMAADAGFDWLELHMAHGYLLASFISPLTNQRTDAYGGDVQARMIFPLEVFDAVRDAWPVDLFRSPL
ncbi:MAG: FAD-dependent monooxygenase, partial [Myxococcota bacterium]